MGLVKTRRLAAMNKQQRAKAAMKLPVKGGARNACSRQFGIMSGGENLRRRCGDGQFLQK